MSDRERARPSAPPKEREIRASTQDCAKQRRDPLRREPEFEHGTKPDQVEKDRLAVSSVEAVSRMLRHVRVDDESMPSRVAKTLELVSLNLPERRPAARCA
jgi:hypothetical protein